MATTVRVGLIGAGFITELHLEAFARVPNAQVVAITGQNTEHARELAQRHGIPHVEPSWEALVSRDDVDVVTVAVPNDLHAPICVGAAERGVRVDRQVDDEDRHRSYRLAQVGDGGDVTDAVNDGRSAGLPAGVLQDAAGELGPVCGQLGTDGLQRLAVG